MTPQPGKRHILARWAAALLLAAAALLSGAPGLSGVPVARAQQGPAIEPAIVSITVTQQRADWYTPWQMSRPTEAMGSGFLIGPRRIMTNAHVVSDARQIIVRRHEDNTPHFAEVEYIAHDSDLALLRVDDPAFSDGVAPLRLGDLPSLRSAVRTYGFPAGGEKISRTEGVVSRIQFITYLHSGADGHLAIQTDSAINPGNSGGPVVQDGRVVGVAFQANARLNDVGYFIPSPVVRRFLADIEDGRYDGYGEMGLMTSNLVNPEYREYLEMPAGLSGVVVDDLLPGGSAEAVVQPGDVVLAIDDVPVANDGTIRYRGHALDFEQLAEDKLIGEQVHLSLWRDGRRVVVDFPLRALPDADQMRSRFDTQPRYFIYAGLVFMVLDQAFLNTFGNYWENADKHLLYAHFNEYLERDDAPRRRIVLSRVLPHQVNSAYRGMANQFLATLNGVPIERLADIEKGLAAAEGRFHHFTLEPSGLVMVLERDAARAAHEQILDAYGIERARRLP